MWMKRPLAEIYCDKLTNSRDLGICSNSGQVIHLCLRQRNYIEAIFSCIQEHLLTRSLELLLHSLLPRHVVGLVTHFFLLE